MKILILEDDLETVEKILSVLRQIEVENDIAFGATIIPDYLQVEEFINKNPHIKFDILLLDRDCFRGGSFHVVNLDNFDLDKVISISSVPDYNIDAMKMGVKRVVLKKYSNLDEFKKKLKCELLEII
jgi:DNA-binding LytR/AlgR family response regulator